MNFVDKYGKSSGELDVGVDVEILRPRSISIGMSIRSDVPPKTCDGFYDWCPLLLGLGPFAISVGLSHPPSLFPLYLVFCVISPCTRYIPFAWIPLSR